MLQLHYRAGFPEAYMDQQNPYVFEIMLNSGTTCNAVVLRIGEDVADDGEPCWFTAETPRVIIIKETVLGWRETYGCDAAQKDIRLYVAQPGTVAGKNYLAGAMRRHLEREKCPECWAYYGENCYTERTDNEIIARLKVLIGEHPESDAEVLFMGRGFSPQEFLEAVRSRELDFIGFLHDAGKRFHKDPLLFIERTIAANKKLIKRD